jgi:hypothetical protein
VGHGNSSSMSSSTVYHQISEGRYNPVSLKQNVPANAPQKRGAERKCLTLYTLSSTFSPLCGQLPQLCAAAGGLYEDSDYATRQWFCILPRSIARNCHRARLFTRSFSASAISTSLFGLGNASRIASYDMHFSGFFPMSSRISFSNEEVGPIFDRKCRMRRKALKHFFGYICI